ncbi:hypothetical protein [Nocardia colli]|uniref:hypothetical protein n=1 Tax=Nocardia colli TaxID=2545717 RepID=UPI0035E27E19
MSSRALGRGTTAGWEDFDYERWLPWAMLRRCRAWVRATRRRRIVFWLVLVVLVLFVFPGVLGAIATAQSSSGGQPGTISSNSALSWMNIRDSDGVEMSQYFLAQDSGGFFEPSKFSVSTACFFVMVGWLIMEITPIYLVGSVESFSWLDSVEAPLRDMSDSWTRVLVTPYALIFGATTGTFFAMWFYIRGFHAKAAYQIMFMAAVAVLGPALLLNPMSRVFSSDGALGMGRDFGLAVASGLNGEVGTNSRDLIARTQMHMADNFGRKPLQTWNFGHVVDQRPACRTAWSRGIESGDTEQVRKGMEACQDLVAVKAIDNPSWGQLGAGLMMCGSSLIFMLFALYLSFKVLRSVFDLVINIFTMILGLAWAGFIHGPPQVMLIKSFVGVPVAGAEMAAFTALLGGYTFLNGRIFSQPDGNMQMLILGAVLQLVFIVRLRKISKAMRSAEHWMANRFTQKLQDTGGKGGGGGAAFGMGKQDNSSATLKTLAALSMLAAVSNSPLTGRMFRTQGNPFMFRARRQQRMLDGQQYFWGTHTDQYTKSYQGFEQIGDIAEMAMNDPALYRTPRMPVGADTIGDLNMGSSIGVGNFNTYRGAAQLLNAHARYSGYGPDRARPALLQAGYHDPVFNARMDAAHNVVSNISEDELTRFGPLTRLRAATNEFQIRRDPASLAVLEQETLNTLNAMDIPTLAPGLQHHVDSYLADPNRQAFADLQQWAEGSGGGWSAPGAGTTLDIGGGPFTPTADEAWQLQSAIGFQRAQRAAYAVDDILTAPNLNPGNIDAPMHRLRDEVSRMEAEDLWAVGMGRSSYTAAPP